MCPFSCNSLICLANQAHVFNKPRLHIKRPLKRGTGQMGTCNHQEVAYNEPEQDTCGCSTRHSFIALVLQIQSLCSNIRYGSTAGRSQNWMTPQFDDHVVVLGMLLVTPMAKITTKESLLDASMTL